MARSLDKMKIAHSELVCTYSVSHARAYSSGSRPCVVTRLALRRCPPPASRKGLPGPVHIGLAILCEATQR